MAAAQPKKSYKPTKSFTAKKKAAQIKQIVIMGLVGAVLLGGLALAFANTRKSQDVRSDASGGTPVCSFTIRNKLCNNQPPDVALKTKTSSAFYNSSGLETTSCVNNRNYSGIPTSIINSLTNHLPSDKWPSGVMSWKRNCWIEPNYTPAPTSNATPVPGSDDEKIIVGGTVYACDGAKLANVPVKAFGNTVYTNAQGKWEVQKNTQIIANGIAEFTVVAGASASTNNQTYFTMRSSNPQFPKVNANCGKINCNYNPNSATAGRGYSVNQYQFGTNLAEYRQWFVTSTASSNPFIGFDFKPVDCGSAQTQTFVNMYAAKNHSANAFYVTATVQPIPGRTIQKVVISHRKVGGGWLGSVDASFANGVWWYSFPGASLEWGSSYEFTANVHYTQGLPCTGDHSLSGSGYDRCYPDMSKADPRTISLPVVHN